MILERIKSLFSVEGLIGLSIFISSYTFFTRPFEGYFHYLIFLILLPFFIIRYGFLSFAFKFMLIPIVFSVINLVLGNVSPFGMIKITVGMLLSITFYNYVIVHYEMNFNTLFKLYLKGIVVCCYIGIIQVICFQLRLKPGYDYTWLFNKWRVHYGSLFGLRLNSIFPEPSQFALMLMPAVFVAAHHLLMRTFNLISLTNCFLVIGCLILTTSSTGYLGILFSLILFAIQFRKLGNIFIISIISVFAFIGLYNNVEEFKSRVDTSVNLWTKDEYTLEDINSSSFVLFNNFHIAKENIRAHPVTGTGLGSFPDIYNKYSLTKAEDFLIKKGFDFNSQDGNSLFIRSMAEMGIIGVIFWFFLIFKYFKRRDPENPQHLNWLYSSACLVIIIGYLTRQGNYFLNGFPFFVLMYYYLSNAEEQEDSEDEIEDNAARPAEESELART